MDAVKGEEEISDSAASVRCLGDLVDSKEEREEAMRLTELVQTERKRQWEERNLETKTQQAPPLSRPLCVNNEENICSTFQTVGYPSKRLHQSFTAEVKSEVCMLLFIQRLVG